MPLETETIAPRHSWLWPLLLFFGLSLVFQIETLLVAPKSDSAAFLYIGARQAAGQMPGRDLWDNKLPLIYQIGRAAMATGSPRAFLWLVEAALTALGALAVCKLVPGKPAPERTIAPARIAAPAPDRAGLAAGILLCVICGAPSYHAGGFMTEVYAMPLSALAVFLSWRSFTRAGRSAGYGIAAGLCWAVAISFRLPLGLAAVGVVGYCAVAISPSVSVSQARRSSKLVCLTAHVVGLLLGVLVVFAHPIAAGYARDSLDVAILWPLGLSGERVAGPLTLTAAERLADFAQDIAKLGWLHAAAIVGFFLGRHGPNRSLAGVAAVWYAAATASAALGWVSYAHYQYVAFAPICLGCGLLFGRLRRPLAGRLAVGIVALTAVVICTQNVRTLTKQDRRSTDVERSAVVDYLHTATDTEASVYIWAWNRSADLLYRIDRPPGNRHFMAHSYFNMDLSLFDEMVEAFVADPPAWIVVDRHRRKPDLIGPTTTEWEQTTPSLRRLREFVQRQYRTEAEFGRYTILRLASNAKPAQKLGDTVL